MHRRAFLRTGVAATGAMALPGCAGLLETRAIGVPPIPEDRPDGIYVPSHVEGMAMIGTAERGDYAFGLLYSYPHRFWTVTGDDVSLTEIDDDDAVHLMASVWDVETGTVLPDTGLATTIYRDGSLVSQEAIYPMLSQPMGFHYGANFPLSGDGRYTVELSVGAMSTRRTGTFADRFDEPATVEIPFEYSEAAKTDIAFERLGDRTATRGAVDPMAMDAIPDSLAPAAADLPGRVVGTATDDGARFVVAVLETPPAGVDGDGRYVAVSPRTRYNRMLLPAMGLAGTLTRGTETVYDGPCTRTLDPDLGYHYGAVVDDVRPGDELELTVAIQPQTARHEGYEMAFGGLEGDAPTVTVTVP
jgi:hypothetical protein